MKVPTGLYATAGLYQCDVIPTERFRDLFAARFGDAPGHCDVCWVLRRRQPWVGALLRLRCRSWTGRNLRRTA